MPACAVCGQDNPGIARFCLACGAPLAPAAADAREERKVVSVLFADVVDSTARAERLDPEDVRRLLETYWQGVRAELERFGGTVEKFIGDAVVAFFGAPAAREDDAERAVRAALAIRDWIAEQPGDLQLRVAVTTGEALVRIGARPLDGEGIATGDVVNTAARLQAAAPANGVLVDETTRRATAHAIEYRTVEPVAAKGKREPVPAWEALQPRSRTGTDVPDAFATRLVGRRRELDELRDALARSRHDRTPQLVTLVGVPGIGKSRLVHELSRLVDADPELVRWRQGRSLPYGEGAAYWALGEMVKAEAGILESDAAEAAEAKLGAAVADAVEDEAERARVAAHLRPLAGLPAADAGAGDRRAELFAGWRRFLEGLAERRPTVLVFEDLHWADDALLDFVDHLADWASGVPLLVVATARPELLERRPGWGGGKRNAATLTLTPLDDGETGELVGALAGDVPLTPDLQQALVARAGGNPLYAEQYVRMLDECSDPDMPIPETVQGLIAARIDLLAADEKALLQDAAVLGKVFWLGAVASLGEAGRARAEELLHRLERKEFVQRARRTAVAGEIEYAFRHILARDVAYNQIPRARRAEKHRLAAEWIGGLGRSGDHADLLAHHYLAALELARAAGTAGPELAAAARAAASEAGTRAAALYAFAAAERFYEAALALGDPEPELLYRLSAILHELGRPHPEQLMQQAYDALLAAGDVEHAAEVATRIAHIRWVAGDRDAALAQLEVAGRLIEGRPPSEQKAVVLANQARFLMLASRGAAALAVADEALAMAEELGLDYVRAQVLNTSGVARVLAGDARGVEQLRVSIALAERLGAVEAVRGHINIATVLSFLGDSAESRRHHERGYALARELGNVYSTIFLRAELARDRYHAGEWDDALLDAEAVAAAAKETPHLMESVARQMQGEILAARGRFAAAEPELDRAVAVARASGDPQTVFPALAGAAEALYEAGAAGAAEALCDELLEQAVDHRHVLEEWAIALALVLRALGRLPEIEPVLAGDRLRAPWGEAVAAIVAGDLVRAADAARAAGDLPHEARLRLLAASDLAASGRHDEARAELRRALGFYRSVGAARDLEVADALGVATA